MKTEKEITDKQQTDGNLQAVSVVLTYSRANPSTFLHLT